MFHAQGYKGFRAREASAQPPEALADSQSHLDDAQRQCDASEDLKAGSGMLRDQTRYMFQALLSLAATNKSQGSARSIRYSNLNVSSEREGCRLRCQDDHKRFVVGSFTAARTLRKHPRERFAKQTYVLSDDGLREDGAAPQGPRGPGPGPTRPLAGQRAILPGQGARERGGGGRGVGQFGE